MKLNDKAVQAAKPREIAYKLVDGDGMYLLVTPSGGRLWNLKYRFLGKEKKLSLGAYPEVSLAEAREKRILARKLLAAGEDPSAVKKQQKQDAVAEIERKTTNTFEAVAKKWHTHSLNGWTPRHAGYVLRRLELDVFPLLGERPIDEITPRDIIEVLRQVEAREAHDLARRLKHTCGQIFRYAIIHEKTTTNPAAAFLNKDALQPYKRGHHAALDAKELSGFLQALERNEARLFPHTRLGMKMLVLTFVRTSELIEARWSEFDLENKVWLIPAERMKMRQAHLVPLSKQVLEILQDLQALRKTWGTDAVPDYVFPNQTNPRKAMSNNTLLKAIERLGYKGQTTGHGFRAVAMTNIKEKLGYRHEVVDRQLAHAPRNKIDAAYDRAEFLDERKVMMQRWADYVENAAVGNVIQAKFGGR